LYAPQSGDVFDILIAECIQGSFGSLLMAVLDPILRWDIDYLIDADGTTDVL